MSGRILVPWLLAFLIGIVAGLRAMTAIAWAARLGKLRLSGTWLAFLGYAHDRAGDAQDRTGQHGPRTRGEGRARLATALGSDRPAALLEDAIAIGAAVVVVLAS